ncbi:MAG: type II toxin-antitoxin system RelE/ParE family toxin [Methylococcaceae bacterium]
MIKTFKDKNTQALFLGERVQRFIAIETVALRKLAILNRAACLNDLRVPPANHLEKLKGDRVDSYSIRINDQFRLCFRFVQGDAFDVEIIDYH